MQLVATSLRRIAAALGAVATDFQSADDDMKAAVALNLAFEAVEEVALELQDGATAQTGHVDVIALGAALVVMLLALHVHQVELVDEAVAFQKFEGAIYRDPINSRVEFASVSQDLRRVEMLLGGLDYA